MTTLGIVSEWLFVGSWRRVDALFLRERGCDAIVVVANPSETVPPELLALPGVRPFVQVDGEPFSKPMLERVFSSIRSAASVAILCSAGQSRSASLATAALVDREGIPVGEAMARVAQGLSFVTPWGERQTRFEPAVEPLRSALAFVGEDLDAAALTALAEELDIELLQRGLP